MEITITYETLFELVRLERNREELQKIDPDFYLNVLKYLNEKHSVLAKDNNSLFAAEEKRSTLEQLDNVKRLLKELYERREKKIIAMGINHSRTGSAIAGTENFLKEEKQLYDSVVSVLNRYRTGILSQLLQLKDVEIAQPDTKAEEKQELPTKLIRFTHAVPSFVGTNLEVYGPYEEEDMATLPTEIANVIIARGRAEMIDKQ